ncbi:MAG TPA: penicillin-insensitive murein endopeptidase [Polyangiaceae bacterium]|nr:penicillin-insensitive murein endopeptidase [Polyangiaceae bacterium]
MNPPLLPSVLVALLAASLVVEHLGHSSTSLQGVPARTVSLHRPLALPRLEPQSLADEVNVALLQLEPPLSGWPAAPEQLLPVEIEALGSMAVGKPNRGALFNAVQLPTGAGYEITDRDRAWGTTESVATLAAVLAQLHGQDLTAPKLYIGQMSAEHGGFLKRHKSHQSGCDVDVGLYYRDGEHWYATATEQNLDVARTWNLVNALVDTGRIEYIFADRSILHWLEQQADRVGTDPERRRALFYDPVTAQDGVLRHAWGHRTHLHVRFKSVLAEQRGRQLAQRMISLRMIPPRKYY